MNIYDIDRAMFNLIDEETGEIRDYEAFERLSMARDKKIENALLWHKNLMAEAKAIKDEEEKLKERRTVCENRAKRLKEYAASALSGEEFKTPRVSLGYRKSSSVEVDPEFIEWAMKNANEFLKYSQPEPNKTVIKTAIKNGMDVRYVHISEKRNIIIK